MPNEVRRRVLAPLLLLAGLVAMPASAAAQACVGDCNDNRAVSIDELVRSVNIALGSAPLTQCAISDANGDGAVAINELITAVNNALFGCPARPTPTFTPVNDNQAPQVQAGADVLITIDDQASLTGSISDDGKPNPPAALTVRWELVEGPGQVVFGAASAAATTVTFSAVGSYRLRLTADDGERASSDEVTVHVDLSAVNQAPTLDPVADQTLAAGSALRLGLVGRDPNPFDGLTYALVSGPPGATVDAQGVFGFAPLVNQLGAHPVTVQVADPSGLSAQASFDVVVVTGNRPPAFGGLPDATIPSGVPFARQLTASDPDGDALSFALLSAPEGLTLAGAQLTWTPGAGQVGTHLIDVEVRDPSGAATAGEFRLLVPGPTAPRAQNDRYEVILGRTLTVPAAGVLANDASVDGSPLSAQQLTQPDKGSVTAFGTHGGFTYVAPPALPPPPPLDATVKYQLHYGNSVILGNYPPLVADMDGDGKAEIIFWRGDTMTVVHGDSGEELFSTGGLPEPYQSCAMYGRGEDTFAAADIDDDGVVEIVMSAQCAADNFNYIYVAGNATRLVALAYDASAPSKFVVKWLSEPLAPQVPATPEQGGDGHLYVPFGGQAAYTAVTIARLRPTEAPTVLLGKSYSSHGGPQSSCGRTVPGKEDPHCRIVFALDGTSGAMRTPFYATPDDPGSVGPYGDGSLSAPSAVSVADVDADGELDLLYQGTLWNLDGTVKRQFDGTADTATGTADSLLVDLDGDTEMEIVAFDNANYRRTHILRAWKADGRLLWKLTFTGDTVVTRLGAADIDRSGRPTILFAIRTTLYAVDHRGQFKWVRQLPHDSAGFHSLVSTAGVGFPVYDLNGDGIVEIVVQFDKSTILFLRGDTGETQTSWAYPGGENRGSQSKQQPVIADLDGTGEASLIWYHDVNLNNQSFLQVLKGASAPWRAAPSHLNQRAFWGTNFNPDGSVPATYPRHTADPRTNVYLQPPPVPYTLEPRLRTQARFTYAAQDGPLASAPATVTIDILPENRPPVVTALPPEALAIVNFWEQPFTFQLAGVDPDPGDVITFGPAEEQHCGFDGRATISPEGLFTLRGRPFDETQCIFRVTLADGHGGEATAPIVMFFTREKRRVPNLVGADRSTALNAVLSRELTLAPQIDLPSLAPAGEVLAQHPPAESEVLRNSRVQLTVSLGPGPLDLDGDGDGFTPNQGDCDDADPDFNPGLPEIADNGVDENCDGSERIVREVVVEPASALRVTGEVVNFTATAVYLDGTSADVTATANWASAAPTIAAISAAGRGRAVDIGSAALRATFGGAVGHARFDVADRAAGDQDEPTAIIATPADGGTITGLTQVTGTAVDANFLRYQLAVAPAGEASFTVVGEGPTAVTDGVLGSVDPTLLVNGQYRLRLTVVDANENAATTEVSVLVDGFQKVGNFTVTYSDLSIPLSGLPIQVQRTYDSRDKRSGAFGVGWTLTVNTLQISPSRVLGSGWEVVRPGLAFALVPVGDHRVSLALPSGRVESFDLQLAPTVSPLVPLSAVRASYVARPGSVGALESLDNNDLRIVDPQPGPVTLLDDVTLNDYHPNRFRYTAPDGTQYVLSRSAGVESVRDANANQLTIGPGGITHSNGTGVSFSRDGQGRITAITDPKGHSQAYAYSPAGDLVAHTDAAGSTTRYLYDRAHGLLRIEDPLGRSAARAEYDDEGRLVSLSDGAGQPITFEHDVEHRRELVRDALGRARVLDFDARGNVLAVTDPLGARSTFSFDARGNQLTETDPLGATTSYTYDAHDNVASITDALGHATTRSYDAGGRLLSATDPRGHKTTLTYDAQGNLASSTDPLGNTIAVGYDAAGNPRTWTDAAGHIYENEFDAAGRRTRMIDALGLTTTLAYDANGNLTGQGDGGGGASWALNYDAANRIVGAAVGGYQRALTYDAAGAVTQATNAAGGAVPFHFDLAGRLTGIERPAGGSALARAYDAVGNVVADTDAAGNVTRYTYDVADRLVGTTFPDGSMERRSYDAGGRLLELQDALGRVTRYRYDALGQVSAITDALGGETTFQYDPSGNVSVETDAAGRTTTYRYDALNRVVETTFADGATLIRSLDETGRLVETRDAAGAPTRFAYDALGRLSAVTDALGQVTRTEYDGMGPRRAVVDANGHTTRFEYDGSARPTRSVYPLGDSERATYDATGRVLSRTNGTGESVGYEYDDQGRLTRIVEPGGAADAYEYTIDGLVSRITNADGVTRFDYDPRTRRLLRITDPDASHVRYAYDAKGNRTLMAYAAAGGSESITRFAHDALDRLIEITDPSGGITRQAYDAVGNLTSIVRPNGTRSEFAYDPRHRVAAVVHRSGGTVLASEIYTRDLLGNTTRVERADGSRLEYAYDALSRLTAERHLDAGGSVLSTAAFAYDAVGNLIRRGDPAAPTLLVYNANDQLVSAGGIAYAYDAAGRRIEERPTSPAGAAVRYAWDARDRLRSFTAADGTTTAYRYDFAGMRQAKVSGAGTTRLLADRYNATTHTQIVDERSPAEPRRSFVFGAQLLAETEAGVTSARHADGIGSTRLLTSAAAGVTGTFDYDAYGALVAHSGAATPRHLFAGEYFDPESERYYLRARYYDPLSGAFLSRDPARGDVRNPLSLNRYVYALGNPVNRVDPSGQEPTLAGLLVSATTNITARGQQVVRVIRGKEKAEEIVGETMRRVGGVLAVFTLVETATDRRRVVHWFGGTIVEAVAENVPVVGAAAANAIALGAGVNLSKIAFDMLGSRVVDFDVSYGGLTGPVAAGPRGVGVGSACGGGEYAAVNHYKSQQQRALRPRENPTVVDLCGRFFTSPPVPLPAEGMEGRPSMAGIMVHEFAHISVNAVDNEYLCNDEGGFGKPGVRTQVPGLTFRNADNYRCWVRDSAIGYGNGILKRRLGQ